MQIYQQPIGVNQRTGTIKAGDRILSLDTPLIMGILNVTSDSFFDGGWYSDADKAIERCGQMLREGATIIDLGANSSRPGSVPVGADREWMLLEPVIRGIRGAFPDAVLSVDTFESRVAAQALNLGVHIINDISAGEDDPHMLDVISGSNALYVAMHKKGATMEMQKNPTYENVLEEVHNYFVSRLRIFRSKGIEELIIDPGFGFGKTVEHNYTLLRNLDSFISIFQLPVLVGVSRKSMINKVLGTTPENALNGSSVLHTLALLKGASILRVHDVKEAVECVRLVTAFGGEGIE